MSRRSFSALIRPSNVSGETSAANLALFCQAHHTALHEHGAQPPELVGVGVEQQVGDQGLRLLLREVHAQAFVDARPERRVGEAVARLLRLASAPEPSDAADGVAIALTHLIRMSPRTHLAGAGR